MSTTDKLWIKYSKYINITKYSKIWWNEECSRDLSAYNTSRSRSDWSKFKKMVKRTKRIFFNEKIQEIATRNKKPWNLMNWVKNSKLPAKEAIKFNRHPCIKLSDLQQALYLTFNLAQDWYINFQLLNKITSQP